MIDPIVIPERLHTVEEVAAISAHTAAYVRDLIDSGVLRAVRPMNPQGRPGQIRIFPDSIRKWMGLPDQARCAPKSKRVLAEIERGKARFGRFIEATAQSAP